MKKFLLVFLLAAWAGTPLHAQLSIGFRGGYNLATMHYKDPAAGYKNNGLGTFRSMSSWHADLVLNMPLGYNFYLQPVLRYITKGTDMDAPYSSSPTGVYLPSADKIRLHYLELPLNLVYKIPVSFGKITFGAGPYAGYGLGGNYQLAIRYNGNIVSNARQDISFEEGSGILSTNTRLRHWDAGANFMAGVELNNLVMLNVNYSLGMVDTDKSTTSSLKNRYLGISLGILLDREDY
ncbi:MAG TPA: outer membrane beta-barrel protein [Chitinophaga sp.]|uniref:outer membrane beta-barrel protein n=1 Tax=Chitinophaga sp. TaxID=1869181 RepID=UPI002DB861D4|nr:outer membrane beta-barrel protein [Chitinophaga sp.]HEU4552970.1 outer membrane beta-barrel protein [Chitinophaga sp.]